MCSVKYKWSHWDNLFVICSFTYEVAPVFVLMETEVLRGLRQLVGWTEGDGIFCPGGSTSNMYAMNLARYKLFPEVKTQGLWCLPRLAIFTSFEVKNVRWTLHVWGIVDIVENETVSEMFMCVLLLSMMLMMMCSFGFVFFQSHYSVKKGAAFLGMGTDNVILVNVDDG